MLAVATCCALACQSPSPAVPALPKSTLELAAPPKVIGPAGPDIATDFAPGQTWQLTFEYVASQRVSGQPDLDLSAHGTAILFAEKEGIKLSDTAFQVRPSGDAMESVIRTALPTLISTLEPHKWRTLGKTSGGTLTVPEGKDAVGWAVVDSRGVVRLEIRKQQSEINTRLGAQQMWRLVLKVVRN